ncbi:MAG: hypothetical protein J6N70_04930 [Oribacterium sp.]|nr:hypothetical protein [Oribacterium sp.]
MMMAILSMIANAAYLVILNIAFYTDRVKMPTGEIREWHRSPVTRLNLSGQSFLFYLQIVLAAVSILTSVLLMFGVRSSIIKTIQLVSMIGSTVIFVIIMIVTANSHVHYV